LKYFPMNSTARMSAEPVTNRSILPSANISAAVPIRRRDKRYADPIYFPAILAHAARAPSWISSGVKSLI
jgi:hypothetical protein